MDFKIEKIAHESDYAGFLFLHTEYLVCASVSGGDPRVTSVVVRIEKRKLKNDGFLKKKFLQKYHQNLDAVKKEEARRKIENDSSLIGKVIDP